MGFYPTQSDIHLLFQEKKKIFGKVELLNSRCMVIGNLEGEVLSDSFNVDDASNIRRTYSCVLHVTDASFRIEEDKKIWFDKYIRAYVGVYSLREQKIIWYLKGTFSPASASYTYDSSSRTLSIQCNDLMCMLTGDIDGVQPALNFKIPAGEDIRISLIGILKKFGFTKFRIESLPRNVPCDLEFGAGAAAYDIIAGLMNFCPNFEFFFDLDGTFVVQRIPCYTDDPDLLDSDVFQKLVVSEDNYTVNFSAKNCVELWGKTYTKETISRFTENCSYADNIYTAVFDNLAELTDYMVIGIKIPASNRAGFQIRLSELGTFPVVDDYEREIKEGLLNENTPYVFMVLSGKLYFLGETAIHAQFKNELPDSPFSVLNIGRELWAVCSGGDYETITSETQARERAMYEAYYKANLNESLTLTLVDIPWLDVNKKITYTLQSTGKTSRWMIHSISSETGTGLCTVGLSRFYPDWSEVFIQEYLKE